MEQKTFETQGFVHDLSPLKQLKKAWLERLKHERSEGARDMLVVPSFDSRNLQQVGPAANVGPAEMQRTPMR